MTEKLLRLKQDIKALRLIPASGGKFEVSVNGHKIYSKVETGEFPDPDAILKAVRKVR